MNMSHKGRRIIEMFDYLPERHQIEGMVWKLATLNLPYGNGKARQSGSGSGIRAQFGPIDFPAFFS
jgi:hypothetical protein